MEVTQLVPIANCLIALVGSDWLRDLVPFAQFKKRDKPTVDAVSNKKKLCVTSIITRFFAVVPISALLYIISWGARHFVS